MNRPCKKCDKIFWRVPGTKIKLCQRCLDKSVNKRISERNQQFKSIKQINK